MRRTFSGQAKGYSGRGEYNDAPQSPDLSKTPNLRKALSAVADVWPAIAESAGCKTKDLKWFANGKRVTLPEGITGRVIDFMRKEI